MLYIKDGIFRDSKKYLQTSDGRAVFNASPEQWEAEGWEVYVPKPEPIREKSLEEKKQDLLEDAKNFRRAIFNVPYSKEERAYYRILAEDLLEQGETKATLFDDTEQEVDLQEAVGYFKALNIIENQITKVLNLHLNAIEKLETEEDINNYDYTTGYPSIPEFK